MTPRRLAAGLGAVIVAGAGAAGMAAWHPWPRTGADRIEHAVQWRGDCASISTTSPALAPEARRWRRATTTAAVSCEFLGPSPDIPTDLQEHRDRNAQLAALRRFFGAQSG